MEKRQNKFYKAFNKCKKIKINNQIIKNLFKIKIMKINLNSKININYLILLNHQFNLIQPNFNNFNNLVLLN